MLSGKLIEYVREKEREINKISNLRLHNYKSPRVEYYRNNADIDYSRVVYSSYFRRLQGKMQLFPPGTIHFFRNRLTHSLEVAQISKILAYRLGLQDNISVQTCSLAHDIGNAPFGHAGEIALDNCSEVNFEGNAQTFRVLTHLEEKHYKYNGLNLTARTLFGVVKYPFLKKQSKNKYLYNDDYNKVHEITEEHDIQLCSIDCQIMDIADEIAYAAHDLEDAFRLNCFNPDEILYEFFQADQYAKAYKQIDSIFQKAKSYGLNAKTYCTSEEYSILFKRELTSILVHTLIKDVDLVYDDKKGFHTLSLKKYKTMAKGLKELTFNAIKRRPEIIRYELMGSQIIKGLYEVLMDKKFNKNQVLLPPEFRVKKPWKLEESIIDYIGGMMDSYAIDQYKIYYGKNSLDHVYKCDKHN
jgi:dGTPase